MHSVYTALFVSRMTHNSVTYKNKFMKLKFIFKRRTLCASKCRSFTYRECGWHESSVVTTGASLFQLRWRQSEVSLIPTSTHQIDTTSMMTTLLPLRRNVAFIICPSRTQPLNHASSIWDGPDMTSYQTGLAQRMGTQMMHFLWGVRIRGLS